MTESDSSRQVVWIVGPGSGFLGAYRSEALNLASLDQRSIRRSLVGSLVIRGASDVRRVVDVRFVRRAGTNWQERLLSLFVGGWLIELEYDAKRPEPREVVDAIARAVAVADSLEDVLSLDPESAAALARKVGAASTVEDALALLGSPDWEGLDWAL